MDSADHTTGTFFEHVTVLRKTLLAAVGLVIAASATVHFFREPIIGFLLAPLGSEPAPLQFLSPLDPLFFILKIDFTLGLLISLPILFYLGWRFIAPASRAPTWAALIIIGITSIMGLGGAAYAYHVVIPIVLEFMNTLIIAGTTPAYTATGYLSFLLSVTTLLVLVFQIPLVIVLTTMLGLLNPNHITERRAYVYTGTVVAAAIITPTTDVITLTLVSLPAIVVTEVGVFVARWFHRA
jgi:sec-independent protein translocase protein TatC